MPLSFPLFPCLLTRRLMFLWMTSLKVLSSTTTRMEESWVYWHGTCLERWTWLGRYVVDSNFYFLLIPPPLFLLPTRCNTRTCRRYKQTHYAITVSDSNETRKAGLCVCWLNMIPAHQIFTAPHTKNLLISNKQHMYYSCIHLTITTLQRVRTVTV